MLRLRTKAKKWLSIFFSLLILCIVTSGTCQLQVPPKPTNSIYIQDYANILDSTVENKINTLGSQLAIKTKAQVVVVTISTLENTPIDIYALEILRKWGIGDKELNNGVVILVAPNDRQSRIEVGYGLEGILPDGKTGRIQDEYMLPFFSKDDYNSGVYNGYIAVINEVAKEYNVALTSEIPQKINTQNQSWWDSLPWWGKFLGALIIVGFVAADLMFFGGYFTYLILSLLRLRGGGGGSGGGGYGGGSGGGGGSSRRW